MKLASLAWVSSGLFTALMAGLFFAYSISVSWGLGKLPDAEYLRAMQSINREIQNPIFFLCFFGTLVLLPLACMAHYASDKAVFTWLLGASLTYAIGVFGLTVFGNVPLNNQLESLDISRAGTEALQDARRHFEGPWNAWNHVRTLACCLSLLCVLMAKVLKA